jgi:diguanylate cyclase (GGDEF)-like protein/PAS domain S-box-containing protein
MTDRPANILLVDDNASNLLALEAVLEPLGHNLVRASSGDEALRRLLEQEFAVILLDVQMPGLDGFQTATYIKQREKTRNVPIIFITGVSKGSGQVFRGYSVGAVDYVLKPVEQDVLRSKVQVFSELYLKENALQESEERFRSAFDNAPIGIGLVGPEGRWLQVNEALCRITGYTEPELLQRSLDGIAHPDDRLLDSRRLRRLLAGDGGSYQLEKRYLRADGEVVWVLLTVSLVRGSDGAPLYFIAQLVDLSERKRAEAELSHQALHDSLTGLANRALFIDRVEQAIARLERHSEPMAILFLDLDRFKVVNDSLGHERGDQLLVAVGRLLQGVVRPSDTVARLGGDEFTILCEEVGGARGAIAVAERIAAALQEPFEIGGGEVFTTASVGIVLTSDAGASATDLIRDADAAMYRAKEGGKNRYELFDSQMRARAMQRLETERALHRALEREELRVFYQPEVRLDTGVIFGVEALVRWQHPERGLVPPADFVPLAEETGLVVAVDKWVLEEACCQSKRWRDAYPAAPPLSVAVNVSARQFAQRDLVEVVGGALADTDTDPSLLCLEITETVLMEDSDQALRVLAGLKELGVRLSIDDFGTGYSSLSYLRRFEVDILKVDRSFVDGVGRDPHDHRILTAIASLADALSLVTIAEGVETAEQLHGVRRLGFDAAQGYYFAPPQPAPAIGELVRATWIDGAARELISTPAA